MRMQKDKQKKKTQLVISISSLIIATVMFLGFGLFHLTKFETTDEHFWKHDRIEKYYNGIKEGLRSGKWKKTRLNDKPGVTVALISGISVPLFGLEPSQHVDREGGMIGQQKIFDAYHTENTESINFALRLPGLLFNALVILPLIFWLVLKITRNPFLTSLVVLLVGANPILVGMSQVVNPDTFLWGFSAIGILSYIAYLYRKEKKFLLIAGVSTGFALLSKYTANLLFLFYPVLFALSVFFNDWRSSRDKRITLSLNRYFQDYAKPFVLIVMSALAVFVIFMPAALFDLRHFLYGTFYSPTFTPIVDVAINVFNAKDIFFQTKDVYREGAMLSFSLAVFLFTTLVLPLILLWAAQKLQKTGKWFLKGLLAVMLFIFLFSFANAWLGTPFFSLHNLKEESRVAGQLLFPDFADDPSLIFWLKAFSVQAQNLIFSLTPIVVISVLFLWVRTLQEKVTHKKLLPFIYFSSTIAPLVFFAGALSSDIFVNIRYSLILFPLFAFLGAIGVYEAMQLLIAKFPSLGRHSRRLESGTILIVILMQFCSLWSVRSHYFSYHSMLLPNRYLVTDSWGYGSYEAAEYLNSLSDAKNVVVWTDHRGLCQFFVGKCVVSREIHLEKTNVDYFVFSRRGSIVKHFTIVGPNPRGITSEKYYEEEFIKKNTVFEEHVANRPANFVRVVRAEK